MPPLGTEPITQACALTGNWTSDLSLVGRCPMNWATPVRAEILLPWTYALQINSDGTVGHAHKQRRYVYQVHPPFFLASLANCAGDDSRAQNSGYYVWAFSKTLSKNEVRMLHLKLSKWLHRQLHKACFLSESELALNAERRQCHFKKYKQQRSPILSFQCPCISQPLTWKIIYNDIK